MLERDAWFSGFDMFVFGNAGANVRKARIDNICGLGSWYLDVHFSTTIVCVCVQSVNV